jgi:hypothetical protein
MKLVNKILVFMRDRGDGYFEVIFLVCYLCFIILKFFERIELRSIKDRWIIQKRIGAIFFYIIMLFWYLTSLEVTGINVIQFLCYAILATFISSNTDISLRTLINSTFIIGLIALPFSNDLFITDYRNSINMDVSYAVLPCVIAGIIQFFCYKKDKGLLKYFIYIVSIYYFSRLLMNGMRGTILCVIIAFFLAFYFGNGRKKITISKFIFAIFIILILMLYKIILDGLQLFLSNHNLSIYALDKFLRLSGNISNGRYDIWFTCFKGFLNSPIWGNGLDSFKYYTGFIYPHNFLLQIMFEGGVLILSIFLAFTIKGTRYVLNIDKKEIKFTYIFVFSVSVPYLFFSANMWITPLLWIFVGLMIRYSHFKINK